MEISRKVTILISLIDIIMTTKEIQTIQGATITIFCDFINNDVIWKGPYEQGTIYSESSYVNHNLPKHLHDRLFIINRHDGRFHLRIVNIQLEDEGVYECYVNRSETEPFETYNLSIQDLLRANHNKPSYYRFMMIDSALKKLVVGSMNYVDTIDIAETGEPVKKTMSYYIPARENDFSYCILSKPETPYCQNHIKFVTKMREDVFIVCGTNADSPSGYQLNTTDGSRVALGSMPCSTNDPFDNMTATYTVKTDEQNHNELYFGGTTNGDSTISRQIYNSDGTVTDDMKGVISNTWMNKPQFVASFEVGSKVLFFLREIAVEVDPEEHKLYSRVSKVCKDDNGGNSLLRKKWTSYQKATLDCSIPGEFPVYFDVIEDVVERGNIFYGLFTTSVGLSASAICAFNLSTIESVLDGSFKTQKAQKCFWTAATNVPVPRPGQCTNDSLSLQNDVLQFIVDHPLMHQSVQPLYGKPIFVLEDEELQQLELHSNMTELVFYAASNAGKLFKLFSKNETTYISTQYSIGNADVIRSIKQNDDSVYIGTDTFVRQIKVINCEQYRWIDSCVRDPHCAWDNKTSYKLDGDDKDEIQCYNRCLSRTFAEETSDEMYTHENTDISQLFPVKCPPAKPRYLRVHHTSDTTLDLNWHPGSDGGYPQTYVFSVCGENSSCNTTLVSHAGSKYDPQYYRLSELNQSSLYDIKIKSKNEVGNCSFTRSILVATAKTSNSSSFTTDTDESHPVTDESATFTTDSGNPPIITSDSDNFPIVTTNSVLNSSVSMVTTGSVSVGKVSPQSETEMFVTTSSTSPNNSANSDAEQQDVSLYLSAMFAVLLFIVLLIIIVVIFCYLALETQCCSLCETRSTKIFSLAKGYQACCRILRSEAGNGNKSEKYDVQKVAHKLVWICVECMQSTDIWESIKLGKQLKKDKNCEQTDTELACVEL